MCIFVKFNDSYQSWWNISDTSILLMFTKLCKPIILCQGVSKVQNKKSISISIKIWNIHQWNTSIFSNNYKLSWRMENFHVLSLSSESFFIIHLHTRQFHEKSFIYFRWIPSYCIFRKCFVIQVATLFSSYCSQPVVYIEDIDHQSNHKTTSFRDKQKCLFHRLCQYNEVIILL